MSTEEPRHPSGTPDDGRPVASVSIAKGRPVLASDDAAAEAFRRNSPRKRRHFPPEPKTWRDAGFDHAAAEALVLRHLLNARSMTGRVLSDATCLDLGLVQDALESLKDKKLVVRRGTTVMGDFVNELTDAGREKALQSRSITHYVGPAPVPWHHYLQHLEAQSVRALSPTMEDLQRAFADLQVSDELYDQLGPAITSGRALFLHGEPGNGKTSLAERMTRCFGGEVWLPYTLDIGGHYVKLFDPAVHRPVEVDAKTKEQQDRRWVLVERPTLVAGGELSLPMLEIQHDPTTNTAEAPLQLKANLGTFVVDDFGRGVTAPRDLLNRWIYPLERGLDFLSLPDGRKFSSPFDCVLVFSTNLEPRDLADEAFLRRIPYKIHVGDPTEDEFEALVVHEARQMGIQLPERSVHYLLERHYRLHGRPMRFCHPRDLLQQVRHLCDFERREATAGPKEWDRVVGNYFGHYGPPRGATPLSPR
ncbi:MAG: AAA family ATPase [Myxococcota bacterium]